MLDMRGTSFDVLATHIHARAVAFQASHGKGVPWEVSWRANSPGQWPIPRSSRPSPSGAGLELLLGAKHHV
jgi:hypothetical protein